jgi:hypothetical protein
MGVGVKQYRKAGRRVLFGLLLSLFLGAAVPVSAAPRWPDGTLVRMIGIRGPVYVVADGRLYQIPEPCAQQIEFSGRAIKPLDSHADYLGAERVLPDEFARKFAVKMVAWCPTASEHP